MQASMTLAMTARARAMRKKGIDVINLSIGEPDFHAPASIAEVACEAIRSNKYDSYPPVAGYDEAREAIAEKLRKENGIAHASADGVVISTGAKQSLMNVVLSTVDPGDEVVLFSPYWVSYPAMVSFAGGKMVLAHASIRNQYKVTADELDRVMSPKTRLVIFSSPSNPTGSVFSYQELQSFVEVLSKYPHALVVSDEIYEKINFTDTHLSIGSFDAIAARTITVNGLSKGFAMTGWRIGYIHAPVEVARACEKIQGQFTSGANSIAQRTLIPALSGQAQKDSHHMCATYLARRDLVLEALKKIPNIKTYIPQGAFYLFPDVSAYVGRHDRKRLIEDVNALCMYLLEHARVSTVSGMAFGDPHAIRISYAVSEDLLQEAMQRIQLALSELK